MHPGNAMKQKKARRTRGPAPVRVKIKGDWTDAVKKALEKKRPEDGWPEPQKSKKTGA